MMEATTAGRVTTADEARGPRGRRRGGKLLDAGLNLYAGLALLYLLVPIAVILVFSFNKPQRALQLHLAAVLPRRLEGPVRRARRSATRCASRSRSRPSRR